MSPQAIEMHMIMVLILMGLVLLKLVTLFLLVQVFSQLKAIRMKMRLMGLKLAENNSTLDENTNG